MNENREKILKAALETISKNTISGTRMRLIAEDAQMSQSNLHYHFKTKKDLLLSLLDYVLEKLFLERQQRELKSSKQNFRDKLNVFIRQKKDLITDKKIDLLQIDFWLQGTIDGEIREKIQTYFRSWRNSFADIIETSPEAELFSKEYIEYLPTILVSLMIGASVQHLIDKDAFDLDRYFDVATQMIMQPLPTA